MKRIVQNVERDICGNKVKTKEVLTVAGSHSPIVIPLTGTHRHVFNHFMETQEILELQELIHEYYDTWKGLLEGGHYIGKLRQLAMHQNYSYNYIKHSAQLYV